MIIEFDKPDTKLSPNNKNGRSYFAYRVAKEKAHALAKIITLQAIGSTTYFPSDCLRIRFIHPTKRNHDIDNSLASAKAHIDGFSEALKIDDGYFTTMIITKEYQKGVSKMIFEVRDV